MMLLWNEVHWSFLPKYGRHFAHKRLNLTSIYWVELLYIGFDYDYALSSVAQAVSFYDLAEMTLFKVLDSIAEEENPVGVHFYFNNLWDYDVYLQLAVNFWNQTGFKKSVIVLAFSR